MLAGLSTGGLADPGRNKDFILGARVPRRWVSSDPCLLSQVETWLKMGCSRGAARQSKK